MRSEFKGELYADSIVATMDKIKRGEDRAFSDVEHSPTRG